MLGLASLQPTPSRHSPHASTGFGITRSWRFGEELARVARGILAHTTQPPALALSGDPGIATTLGPVRPPCAVLCRTNAGLFEAAS